MFSICNGQESLVIGMYADQNIIEIRGDGLNSDGEQFGDRC